MARRLFAACWLSAATSAPVVFEPPVLITAADNVGYADSAVGVSDSALLFAALSLSKWPNGSSAAHATQIESGSPVYGSTDAGRSWGVAWRVANATGGAGLAGVLKVPPIPVPPPARGLTRAVRNFADSTLAGAAAPQLPTGRPAHEIVGTATSYMGLDGSGRLTQLTRAGERVQFDLGNHTVESVITGIDPRKHTPDLQPAMVFSESGHVELKDGSILQSPFGNLDGEGNSSSSSVVVFRAEPPFLDWRLHGVVARGSPYSAADPDPGSPTRCPVPCENDIVLLPDGVTVMAVMRCVCSAKSCTRHGISARSYYRAVSSDGGGSWTNYSEMTGLGTVAPRLLLLGKSGPLLLVGGREQTEGPGGTPQHNHDIVLWVSRDGWGREWEEKHSITAAHDAAVPRR